jgi:hypothetical protein
MMSSVQLDISLPFKISWSHKISVISLITTKHNNLDVQYVFTLNLGSIILN